MANVPTQLRVRRRFHTRSLTPDISDCLFSASPRPGCGKSGDAGRAGCTPPPHRTQIVTLPGARRWYWPCPPVAA